ncbi:RecF/RecN/SMC N terminal domain-containing protein, partial [Boletus coccyginus]
SFSSIVGPNGSGKSNTIDALFVFGYRASKMRQGKLSELIHNSARYPDLDDCSVEVHFREIIDLPGPYAYKVVPNSQLVVARIAYKNNSSKYTINARASNFMEVQTLLKGRGIDPEADEIKHLETQLKEVDEYLEELNERVGAAEAAAENSKDDLDMLTTQLEAKREEIQGFRKKEVRGVDADREHDWLADFSTCWR